MQEENSMKIRQTFWAIPLLGMLAVPAAALADGYHDDGYYGSASTANTCASSRACVAGN